MILRNINIFPITVLTGKLYLKQIHDHGHKNRIYKGHPNKNRQEFRAFCWKRYLPSSAFGRKSRHSAGEWELLWVREGQVQASEILKLKAVGPEMLEKTNSSRKLMWLIPETYLPFSACFWVKIRVKKFLKKNLKIIGHLGQSQQGYGLACLLDVVEAVSLIFIHIWPHSFGICNLKVPCPFRVLCYVWEAEQFRSG